MPDVAGAMIHASHYSIALAPRYCTEGHTVGEVNRVSG